MRALAIDTSTQRAGVALWHDGASVAYEQNDDPSLHAERLISLIDRAFAVAGWGRGDIDMVATCVGPGSFTGIRVGLATAKGIALGLDRPLVGVSSLEAMAAPARAAGGDFIVPLLDARKGEIFWAAYSQEGECVAGPGHVPWGEVERVLGTLGGRELLIVGEVAGQLGLPNVRVLRRESTDLPHAFQVARVAVERLLRFGPDDVDLLEPVYVRPPDITQPKAG